jgi:hypothetical protein
LKVADPGIERLLANGGKMRLFVGCTLDVEEIEAIERCYYQAVMIFAPVSVMPFIEKRSRSGSACAILIEGHLPFAPSVRALINHSVA